MGNFIFGYNFVNYTPTASSELHPYVDDNLKVYKKLKQQWRSTSTSQQTISCNFGSAVTIKAVILDDVNFTSVNIGGSNFTIRYDERVLRYKIFADKTSSGTSLTITIPSQTTTDGLSSFRIGRLIFLNTYLHLNMNISYPYEKMADKPTLDIKFGSGGKEVLELNNYKFFSCSFKFDPFDKKFENDLWVLNSIEKNHYVVLYENEGDTSKVYVCYRSGAIQVSEPSVSILTTNIITFEEVI